MRWDTLEVEAKVAPAWTESRRSPDLVQPCVGRGRGEGWGSRLGATPAGPRVRGA